MTEKNLKPWGELYGIRPVNQIRQMLEQNMTEDEIIFHLKNDLKVDDTRAKMSLYLGKKEYNEKKSLRKNSVSLYIGIPFCPTRCAYCSFFSMGTDRMAKHVEPYLEGLLKELFETTKIIKDLGLLVDTVYVGGGTPTTLNPEQLVKLLGPVYDNFGSSLREFTVEAGRPDTVTESKLHTLSLLGVDRISINPQSLNQKTLDKIGRKHTTEQVYKAFNIARKFDFKINMDTITGLPDETEDDFKYTLDEVLALNPENITVHTLSIKRAADLKKKQEELENKMASIVGNMTDYSHESLIKNGYKPYYLYRQRDILGHLENVGWEKGDTPCLYNILMMGEIQTVISVGVGAVTKLVGKNKTERIFNMKDVFEYLNRLDEINEKKKYIYKFMEEEI
ncbi:MAG: coproporphyrinogen dehydrogenase HemZ [Clostridia bacterium]|nr:coproporphyrinogen dehydrogenase HemZ [Clostridia bacterium]